ncbi:MAG: 23S rRNA (uracil(1939)-C(5))-methyltransferase RlmD [Lachnospiraceae bacterium]|nr:23S rRNA (uracil(1939)-C(5))-methyltransferase RlmD [Lachnospiraceae bacterium]MBR6151983.1 23S rRNA (uracil(1939)-C(5))-methyltransferase RlmD [Lachnospiraceae bacterium]
MKEYQKNDMVTVTIEDIGTEGEGIGKVDGFTLFIKDSVPGDVVTAKIMKSKKNYAYARLEKVETPSPFRALPPCKFYRQCGGCQLQAIDYQRQLDFKEQKIRGNLIRIGGFDPAFVDEKMEPIIGMEEPLHYRNKAQYPVGTDRNGNLITGFYAGRTHDIIANTNCLLGAPENQEILEKILDYMRENKVSAYDETTGKGLVRHVLIRKGFTSGQLMVCIVINRKIEGEGKITGKGTGVGKLQVSKSDAKQSTQRESKQDMQREWLPKQESLINALTKIPGMTSISVNFNAENTNVILGREVRTIWGEDTIFDMIHVRDMKSENYPFTGDSLTFKISPLSFYQVNPVQTEKLYSLALEYAGLTGNETVWDLYCGIGTISLFLARKAKQVYGVEIVEQAILDARENAARNGIDNARFFVGKAEEVLPAYYEGKLIDNVKEKSFEGTSMLHPDVIVVDPPRKGCDDACLETMLKMNPSRIVYVSCDSATLARDLKILCAGGYEIQRIRGVDQFGMTVHVETVCLLSKLHEAKHLLDGGILI